MEFRASNPGSVAFVAISVLVVAQLPTFLVGGLAVEIQRDLAFGPSQLGLAVGGSLGISTFLSIWVSHVVQRRGWESGLRWTAALAGLSLSMIGFFADSWGLLLVGLLVAGIGKAFGHPTANLLLVDRAPAERRGILFGLKQSGIPAASMLAGLSVPLIGTRLGWRWTFLLGGAAALALACLPFKSSVVHTSLSTVWREDRVQRGHHSYLVPLAFAVGIAVAAPNTVAAFLTSYAAESGISVGDSGLLLAAASLTGIGVRLAIGWKADRSYLGMGSVSALVVLGCLGIVAMAVSNIVLIVAGAMLALGAGWGWAGLFNQLVATRFLDRAAIATGFTQAGVFAGAALGPALFGWLVDLYDFTVAWLFIATVSAVGGFWLWRLELARLNVEAR